MKIGESHAAPNTRATCPTLTSAGAEMVALLIVVGLFWIAVALLQFRGGWAARPGGEGLFWGVIGFWNLVVGGYTLFGIRAVIHRRYNGQGQLVLISVGATGWALFATGWLGGWFQLLVVPFQIGLGILAWANSAYFASGQAPG